ncbi:AMP-binding protein [Dermabacteraceae bacterium P7054]
MPERTDSPPSLEDTPGWLLPPTFTGNNWAPYLDALAAVRTGAARLWLGPSPAPTGLPAQLSETALVVPTSGSTGEAKAVCLSLAALHASAAATAEFLGGTGHWVAFLPPTHIAGVQVLLRGAAQGGVTTADLSGSFTPALVSQTLSRVPAKAWAGKVFTSLVPTQLERVLRDDAASAALSRCSAVLLGGAAAAPGLLERAHAAGIRVHTTYGSSETAGGCVYDSRPLPGVGIQIEDGRVALSGPQIALGYIGTDGSARELFNGIFRTSDLGELTPHGLRVLGRADDAIITGGRKLHPAPIERTLEERPEVEAACVSAVADTEWGQRPVLLVTPTETDITPEQVTAWLTAAGRERWEIPRTVINVPELPLRGIGKLDRCAANRIAKELF